MQIMSNRQLHNLLTPLKTREAMTGCTTGGVTLNPELEHSNCEIEFASSRNGYSPAGDNCRCRDRVSPPTADKEWPMSAPLREATDDQNLFVANSLNASVGATGDDQWQHLRHLPSRTINNEEVWDLTDRVLVANGTPSEQKSKKGRLPVKVKTLFEAAVEVMLIAFIYYVLFYRNQQSL